MKISIIHPSRKRAQMAAKTAHKWLSSAKDKHNIEYLVSIDDSDELLPYMDSFESMHPAVVIYQSPNNSAIEAINRVAAQSTGDLLIVVSDDFDCPFHWDDALITMLKGKEDFCVKTPDGIQKTLITLPIMDRTYYKRYGYIYNPAYSHMFCDQEMTAVAHMTGKVIELPIPFPHLHYSTGKNVKDEVSIKADSTYASGQKIFWDRLAKNFDIEKPVCSYKSIVWH